MIGCFVGGLSNIWLLAGLRFVWLVCGWFSWFVAGLWAVSSFTANDFNKSRLQFILFVCVEALMRCVRKVTSNIQKSTTS